MKITAVIVAALLASAPAFAQTSTNNVNSNSGADANSYSNNSYSSYSKSPKQAPTAIAPGLAAAGIETCLGSTSGGISGPGWGVSFGTTKEDPGCDIRLTSRQLYSMGQRNAAIALMCQHERVARAMAISGTPCPGYPGYAESLPPNSPMARVASAAPAYGYGSSTGTVSPAVVGSSGSFRASYSEDVFTDSKGREYALVNVSNASEAKRMGAIRSKSGEWVKRIK